MSDDLPISACMLIHMNDYSLMDYIDRIKSRRGKAPNDLRIKTIRSALLFP